MSEGPRVVHTRNPGPRWPPCSFCAGWSLPCPSASPGSPAPCPSPPLPRTPGVAAGEGRRGLQREGVPTWAVQLPSQEGRCGLRLPARGTGELISVAAAPQRSLGHTAVRSCCSGFARWPVVPQPAHPGQGPCSHHLSTGSLLGDRLAFRGSWTASASVLFLFEGPHRMSLSGVGDPIGVTGR